MDQKMWRRYRQNNPQFDDAAIDVLTLAMEWAIDTKAAPHRRHDFEIDLLAAMQRVILLSKPIVVRR